MLRKLYFNLWYYFNPPWETGISPPELMAFIQHHEPGRALDLGCGTGTNVITLAKHNWKVIGVDFASKAIKMARKKAKRAGVEATFLADNVTNLKEISGRFDLILDIGCFHSISDELRGDYLANLERLLAISGTYMLYAFINSDRIKGKSGIDEQDIQLISQRFSLIKREDGSERGLRHSAWLYFFNGPKI